MRRMALVLVVLTTAGCGGGANLAGTHLTFTALNPSVGFAVFRLDCSPAGGDVTDPGSACDALSHDTKLVTSPTRFTCMGGPTSWFDLTISGRLAGEPLHRKFSTCWTAQSPTLGKLGLESSLGRHVRPRRHGRVAAYTTQKFAPGSLRPGDLLVCAIRGHDLKLGIPDRFGPIGSMGWGGKNAVGVSLTASRRPDGSVTASCRRGNA